MADDALTALQRTAGVVADVVAELDPATAWDLDAQMEALARVAVTLAEGLDTWGERLGQLGLHESVTGAAATGSAGLAEIAQAFTAARQNLRTVYAAQFAAAEAQVRQVDRRDFWGETAPADAGAAVSASPAPPGAEIVPGALQLGDAEGSPYLDWSCATAGGGRSIELGDGDDAVVLALTREQALEFSEQLRQTLIEDRSEDFVAFGDGDQSPYIDWSTPLPDGGRQLEMGDGDGNAASIDLTRPQMQALHEQLSADLAAEAGPEAPEPPDTTDAGIEAAIRAAYAQVASQPRRMAGPSTYGCEACEEIAPAGRRAEAPAPEPGWGPRRYKGL